MLERKEAHVEAGMRFVEGWRVGGREVCGWKGVEEGVERAERCCVMGSSVREREVRKKERRARGV